MKDITKEDIAKAKKQAAWGFTNSVLYDLCKSYPKHNDSAVIIGKISIIGRTYFAAVERGAKVLEKDRMKVCENCVAPCVKEEGTQLDTMIELANGFSKITPENLPDILRTHNLLTNVFKKAVGLSKRSLASKYLHFHVPNAFYIYDSIGSARICEYKLQSRALKKELICAVGDGNYDESYLDFVAKAFTLNQKIMDNYGEWVSPRTIDALLLQY